MARKRRVPEVLWRLFRDRARTLCNTVISLIPPSQHQPDVLSLLLRPGDPLDYRKLLNQTFVVLNHDAPPFTHFSPLNRWNQHQIVTRTIEMITRKRSESSNVICSCYDKYNDSSPIVELLTSPAWTCLLKRVGDGIMIYLLEHTSIFLPLPRKKHHQVAGPPISSLIFKLPQHVAESKSCNPSVTHFGLLGEHCASGCGQSFSEAPGSIAEVARNYEENLSEELQGLSQSMVKPRKRSRPFRWQRLKKRRRVGVEEGIYNGKRQHQCTCCSLLHMTSSVTKGSLVHRQPMFYNMEEHSSSVLPKKHVLSLLRPNSSGVKSLVGDIFGLPHIDAGDPSKPCSHSIDIRHDGSACLYHQLIKLFRRLMRQMKSCKHRKLFDKHCCVSSSNQNGIPISSSTSEGGNMKSVMPEESGSANTKQGDNYLESVDSQFVDTMSYCSKSQVVSFIWAVCRNMVPPDLLGSPSNWRILRRNISKFIWLRRYEKFSLNQCMHELKITGFPFLSDKNSLCYSDTWMKSSDMQKAFSNLCDAANYLKHTLLQKWIFWFFSCLIVPLVQCNFYVTESESGKQDIYYYRKSTWAKLRSKAISDMTDQNYQPLDATDLKNILGKRSFGFSKLRLRPKENGIRMLANLKAPSRMPAQGTSSQLHPIGKGKNAKLGCMTDRFKHFKSVNFVLRDTHAILKGIQQKEPQKLGSSVFDYNDIYRKLCPFIATLKRGSATIPNVFIVISDVSKAFDSIDQDKLLDVMNDVVTDDDYLLEQSYQVVCSKKSLWARENLMLSNRSTDTGFTRFGPVLSGSLHTVLVNQGHCRRVKKDELLFNLNEHVKYNILQLDRKFYLQGIGIAQGSIVSSLLCSLYYGHLERNVIFPYLERAIKPAFEELTRRDNIHDTSAAGNNTKDNFISHPCYKLLRFIDDFLFISTSKRQAASFFTRLNRGFRGYNCYMNKSKFSCNFDIGQVSGLPSNRFHVGEDGTTFLRWSGLLLNSCTLEVQADYTRYLNNHLNSSLTVCWHGQPGHQLKMKLCGFMRPKCHPIFFDSNINSAPVVRLNIYQAFLLCAMKFHCYISEISHICQLRARSHLKIIGRSLRYMYVLIKKRMHSASLGSDLRPLLQLREEEVEWLGLNAYIQVLKKKQSRYKELLSLLMLKLSAHRVCKDVLPHLQYAIDHSHSSLLWKIKY